MSYLSAHTRWYAVISDGRRTIAASGPHTPSQAHRIADSTDFRARAGTFDQIGVLRTPFHVGTFR